MAFCRQCGEQIGEARFCPSCGAAADIFQAAASANDIEDNKLISILCYLGILLLIPLLVKPESQFVKYHSNQGLVLLLFTMIIGVVGIIPIIGWLAAVVGGVFSFVCLIMGIVNTVNGEMKPLPLIGSIEILK